MIINFSSWPVRALSVFSLGAPFALYSSDASPSSSSPSPAAASSLSSPGPIDRIIGGDRPMPAVTKFLPAEALLNLSKTNREIKEITIEESIERYIQCIVSDQPIPLEIQVMVEEIQEPTKSNIANLKLHFL
jgi:hypothetical protein